MNTININAEERESINAGTWFSSLSRSLRHDILRNISVRRFADGEQIAARGDSGDHWMGCAKGAVRMGSTAATGKQITLTYAYTGNWFGEVAIFDGGPGTHDCFAHGETTILFMTSCDFRKLLEMHVELYAALMRRQLRCIKGLASTVDDLKTLPMRDRLVKLLARQGRPHGAADDQKNIRIGLDLAQEELGRLLGASRQRVNEALKALEKLGIVRVEMRRVVILNLESLKRGVDWARALDSLPGTERPRSSHW